ncbi:MAG: hypothetical protein H0V44_12290 [Planctomycetes bacterium]|nr:hypothetical protein [Planctomycetota bacterium]
MSRFDDRWKDLLGSARRAPPRALPPVPQLPDLADRRRGATPDWHADWSRLVAAARTAPQPPLAAMPTDIPQPRRQPAVGGNATVPIWERWSQRLLVAAAAALVVGAITLDRTGVDHATERSPIDRDSIASLMVPRLHLPAPPSLPALPRLPAPPAIPAIPAIPALGALLTP